MPALSPASVRRSIQKGAMLTEEGRPVSGRRTSNGRYEARIGPNRRRKLRRRHDGSEQERGLNADTVRGQGRRLLALGQERAAAVVDSLQLNRRLLVLGLMAAAGRADEPLHLAQVKRSPAEARSRDHRYNQKI